MYIRRVSHAPSLVATVIAVCVAAPAPALAQDAAPADAESAPPVEWVAQAKAGLINSQGNTRQTSVNLGAAASRKADANKLGIEGGFAYARSSVVVANDDDGSGAIDRFELGREAQTTAKNWFAKGRYDRFLTDTNALYVAALAGADKIAGKDFQGGGQLGYSRQLFKDDKHEAMAEAAYDLSYESYVGSDAGATSIHSARVFLGDTTKVTEGTGVFLNVEALFNLNEEKAPYAADESKDRTPALKDTRVNTKAGLTTRLWDSVTFSFSATLKFDNNPAPRAAFKLPFADGFRPFSEKTDFVTEAALIVNLL